MAQRSALLRTDPLASIFLSSMDCDSIGQNVFEFKASAGFCQELLVLGLTGLRKSGHTAPMSAHYKARPKTIFRACFIWAAVRSHRLAFSRVTNDGSAVSGCPQR